jgi:hypothetical protein
MADNPAYLHNSVKKLTDVIVHDIFSPPVASRIYAYPSVAAYEVMVKSDTTLPSFAGKLNELTVVPSPQTDQVISYPVAAVHAFLETGKALIFSEQKITDYQESLYDEFREIGVPEWVLEPSLAYGKRVSDHILEWSSTDNYKETRTYPKYSIPDDPTKWQPTPPAYMDGIEPHWREIRPFVLDSAQQFIPPPPTDYSTRDTSRFYTEALEVYTAVSTDTEERSEIAQFWDCNPYVSHQQGHVMFATKKITPGGHWIGITGQACRQVSADMATSARIYTLVAVSLADAFISCWDEKYRSNLVRPETYINHLIDPDWKPLLQTPPFPEHTSGHSVISSAAGEMLTATLGEPFHFTDSVELEYGLPLRTFNSFRDAYHEAAVSRLYGGIHYRPAIDDGVDQGQKISAYIISALDDYVEIQPTQVN